MSEFIDVYTNKKERTGKVIERKQGVLLEEGEYIITVTCWIINHDGEILLTQRNAKKQYGGMWEPTTGVVISGESSLQGVLRELKEEIGLTINPSEIEFVKEMIEKRQDFSFFRDVYFIKKDISIDTIHFLDGEVVNAKYVTIEELEKMIMDEEAFEYLQYFFELYNKYFQKNK